MSKIKKHNNTVPKKIQEPIGTRIAKAVYEEKKMTVNPYALIWSNDHYYLNKALKRQGDPKGSFCFVINYRACT